MPSRLRRLIDKTVFRPIPYPPQHPNQVLAAYFNRTAFTSYFIYFIWACASIPGTVAVLADTVPDTFATYLSFLLIPFAGFAALGALFFPHTGRWELYAGAGMSVILLTYIIIYLIRAISGSETAWVGTILATQIIVIPVSRVVFIYLTLVRESKRPSVQAQTGE